MLGDVLDVLGIDFGVGFFVGAWVCAFHASSITLQNVGVFALSQILAAILRRHSASVHVRCSRTYAPSQESVFKDPMRFFASEPFLISIVNAWLDASYLFNLRASLSTHSLF